MGRNIRVEQLVELVAVVGEALGPQWHFGEVWSEFGVELVAVHAHVGRRVLLPDHSWLEGDGHGKAPFSSHTQMPRQLDTVKATCCASRPQWRCIHAKAIHPALLAR